MIQPFVYGLIYSADGRFLAGSLRERQPEFSGGTEMLGGIVVWDLRRLRPGEELREPLHLSDVRPGQICHGLIASDDGAYLAVPHERGPVEIWHGLDRMPRALRE